MTIPGNDSGTQVVPYLSLFKNTFSLKTIQSSRQDLNVDSLSLGVIYQLYFKFANCLKTILYRKIKTDSGANLGSCLTHSCHVPLVSLT